MDRRVKKTQTAIHNAFIELIKEKESVNDISIKEIVDRADISRSTFYTHYTDIDELIKTFSDTIAEDMGKLVVNVNNELDSSEKHLTIFKNILQYLYDLGPLTKVVILDARNTDIVKEITEKLHVDIADYYKGSHKQIDPDVLYATTSFWINGCLGLIREWAINDFRYSVDEMARLINESLETCSTFFLKK
ncbi:MAG: TetR/AcrR family transcriptional regulator [Oscillospiraceae bacterium]|nr:TetR/AcrR family transcriptional regulator [Candidatus Limimonas coprohippi]